MHGYPSRSGCGALLRSREPLNRTVELATRRQNGQIDGVIRSSMPASACRRKQIADGDPLVASTVPGRVSHTPAAPALVGRFR